MKTVLHTESSPGLGGQEIRTLNEARWMGERGWRVVVAGQPDGRFVTRAREAGLHAASIRMRRAWDVDAVARLIRLIRTEGVSLVHTHSSVDGWVGGLAARAAGVPVLRTRHVSIPVRRGFNPVYTWLADRVVTSGEAIRRIVVDAGVPPRRVIAIPAGVDLDAFPFRARAPETRAALGLTPPVLGSVAMFRGSKGHAHLIQAFARVRAARPTATLLLVGDGIRRTWVEGLAREAGLADRVVFTGFRADVPALLAAMDCFVLASTRTEGVPQSLLQALAVGVPVVASDVGGVPEVVVDGVTGLLAAHGSAEALAARIDAVLDDAAAAERRAAAGRALVERRFSHAASIARLLELYDELLGAPAPTMRPAA
jgi:glycosyltransferase involved in cell wall biosynthesis